MRDQSPLVDLVAPPLDTNRPRRSLRSRIVLTLLALAALVLAGDLLRMLLPPANMAPAHKLKFFERHRDEFDTVFIGPSTTYHQVDPKRFDGVLRTHGLESRSFNFGVGGMMALETHATLARVLDLEPAGLKRVFVELRGPVLAQLRNSRTQRFIWWHDLPNTRRAIRMAIESPTDWGDGEVWRHVQAFGRRAANVGRARAVLADRVAGTAESRREFQQRRLQSIRVDLGEAQNGFVSLDEALRTENEAARRRLERVHRRWLRRRRANPQRDGRSTSREMPGASRDGQPLTSEEAALLVDIARIAEDRDLQLIFFVGPDRLGSRLLRSAHRQGLLRTFLDLDQPDRYPFLFDPVFWFDQAHLNEKGAALYTEALANAYLQSEAAGASRK